MKRRCLLPVLLVCLLTGTRGAFAQRPLRAARAGRMAAQQLDQTRANLERLIPARAAGFAALNVEQVAQAAGALEEAVATEMENASAGPAAPEVLPQVARLLALNQVVDRLIDSTLALRSDFLRFQPASQQRTAVRNHIRALGELIDLSGRLRYLTFDVVGAAAAGVAGNPPERLALVEVLTRYKSAMGAEVMSDLLFEPPKDSAAAAQPPDAALRSKILQLIAVSGQNELLGPLARFISEPKKLSPALAIQAAETIRRLGLPQDPRPDQDPALPTAPITARPLRAMLAGLDASALPGDLAHRREELLAWLDSRIQQGIRGDNFPLGHCDVQPGDWLLMRNPSPYNLFTDLSPGLFTHVGVVAAEQGKDGIRRIVIVDLPERGRMPATNVETFLKRTLHYVVLRHQDPAMARKMAQAAVSTVGNETQFDLTFSTDRVRTEPGESLAGKKMHTYCAGFLLTCALQAGGERSQLFPITELALPGNTQENLGQFGMSIGKDFITPTGSLYSSQLAIVGRREPMYDPSREIEEAIYDHFADGVVHKKIDASRDLYQELRLKMAEASKQNPLLAEALTQAVGVNKDTDLVAAAKAVALIETLDGIAYGNSAEFRKAFDAVDSGPLESLAAEGYKPEQIAQFKQYRQRHAQLAALADDERISPRALRLALVKYYTQLGRQQIDQRFFTPQTPAKRQDASP